MLCNLLHRRYMSANCLRSAFSGRVRMADILEMARQSVLGASAPLPADMVSVRGPRFARGAAGSVELAADSLGAIGYQATHLGKAVSVVKAMLEPVPEADGSRCVIYMGVVANLFATGARDALRFVAVNRQVDHVVVSGGAIEHDLRRLFPHHDYRVGAGRAETESDGRVHLNNVSYRPVACAERNSTGTGGCCFPHTLEAALRLMKQTPRHNRVVEDDEVPRGGPIDDRTKQFDDTDRNGAGGLRRLCYAPSQFWMDVCLRFDELLPKSVADQSFGIACARSGILVYSPSFTDGDVTEVLLDDTDVEWVVDLVSDLNALNRSALKAKKTGMLIVGGGVVKHHVCNANLMRNGADFAVYVNTAQEFDGSDGGARPDEAVSWGKIKTTAKHVKVYGEATLILPLLIERSFVSYHRSTLASQH
jgi:deoxyhypusine synthase